ncbi:MAG: hypothetical protein ACR2FF_08355 [Mycobacteriales bacterium]
MLRPKRIIAVTAFTGIVGAVIGAVAIAPTGATEKSTSSGCSTSTLDARYGSTLRVLSSPGSGNWSQVETKWVAAIGHPMCTTRVYLGTIGAGKTWAKTDMLAHQPANQRVIFSFRGGNAADITAFERSRPAGTQCYGSFWHEPENTYKTPTQQAQYRAKWGQYAPAIRAGGCKTILILEGYTSTDKQWHWEDYYNAGAIDSFGWDVYSYGWEDKPPVYRDPATLLAGPQHVARVTGKHWGVTEAGSPVIPGDGYGVARVAWIKRYHQLLVQTHASLFSIWNDYIRYSPPPTVNYTAGTDMIHAWTGTG